MAWYVFSHSTLCADRSLPQIAEYSITATLGTIAVAYSGSCDPDHSPPPNAILYFLIVVAITEQTTGYTWDKIDSFTNTNEPVDPVLKSTAIRAFTTTVLCQAGEFWVLATYIPSSSLPFIWYTVAWILFGVWAWLRYPFPFRGVFNWCNIKSLDERNNAKQLSELGYSILSTLAKVGLFLSIVLTEDWENCAV